MARHGICKLCLKESGLQKSHAIPNTYFRRFLRTSNGNAIELVGDSETDVSYSNDSGKEYQLCRACEALLNRRYESYTNDVFCGIQSRITELPGAVSYSGIDSARLIMFFISVLWRAANSDQAMYSNVVLTEDVSEIFRTAILYQEKLNSKVVGVRCARLIDRTHPGGFSQENLLDFIMSPFPRLGLNFVSYCFIFFGIFSEIRIGGFRHKERMQNGVLRSGDKVLLMPYVSVFDIPELKHIFIQGYKKWMDGKSKVD